ncbi:MAG TPA: transketolase C-terminal domain-containing protein, partial [Candidatus Kapabacteria bacterium]|nr:transketolase C-terminal domain-containing protein [Candidatus Kapabacteria bacterium]
DKVFGGFGGEIASTISDEMFKFLDAPVRRIGSKNTPVGFAKSYENEILLSVKDVIDAATSLMKY